MRRISTDGLAPSPGRSARRGLTLVEVLVALAISALVLVFTAQLVKSASREFETGSSQVVLSQTARQVLFKITHYMSSAVPAGLVQGQYIYSPVEGLNSQDPDVYPNIYSLDFISCVDFLDPRSSTPEVVPGYLNRRGTRGPLRYRIRYDLPSQQLLVERLRLAPWPDPPGGPTVDTSVTPRLLGRNLHRITFERADQGIVLRISARTLDRQGRPIEGLTGRDGRTLNPDDPNAPRHHQAREYELFTTVMVPFTTVR